MAASCCRYKSKASREHLLNDMEKSKGSFQRVLGYLTTSYPEGPGRTQKGSLESRKRTVGCHHSPCHQPGLAV